jgi:hypothetical protein
VPSVAKKLYKILHLGDLLGAERLDFLAQSLEIRVHIALQNLSFRDYRISPVPDSQTAGSLPIGAAIDDMLEDTPAA